MKQFSPENFVTMFGEVSAMNLAFGNTFGGNTPERIQKQCANIPDEFKELQAAIADTDITEVRDAMCDILVFSLGAFHLLGRNFDELYGHEGVPHVKYYGDTFKQLEQHTRRFDPLMINLERHLGLHDGGQHAEESLADIIDWAMQIADITGYPALDDMRAVYLSNMSKFCTNDDELDRTVEKYGKLGIEVYSEGEYPIKCVKSFGDQKDNQGQNYPSGKFLKGVNYQPPVFA